jgi:hypothetical protein
MTEWKKKRWEYDQLYALRDQARAAKDDEGLKELDKKIEACERARKALDGSIRWLREIRRDTLYWKDQRQHRVTLKGSDKHHYFFTQFKQGDVGVRILGGKTVDNIVDPFTHQSIVMVTSPEGHCVVAEMHMLTGWINAYFTTIKSLTLNLEDPGHSHIKLEEVT